MSSLLEATSLRFAYGSKPVLGDVALALESGKILAVVGPNGSGKSTLIKVLMGHLRGTGRIHWLGREVRDWRRQELARVVTYLPQFPVYEDGQSVADVLRLGRLPYLGSFGLESARDLEVVEQVAGMLGLREQLEVPMDHLSGGQRQRVLLGRCLVQEAKAILLDEPTTFLDLKYQVDLAQLLRGLARERLKGVLLATHDLNWAAGVADQMLLLQEGQVRAIGTPAEVLDPHLLREIWGVRMQRIESSGGIVVYPVGGGTEV